jgi:hypothetical protein
VFNEFPLIVSLAMSVAALDLARPQTAGEEELQLQLALAMSREEAEQEEQKRRSDDVRLQLAISQSQNEYKYNPLFDYSKSRQDASLSFCSSRLLSFRYSQLYPELTHFKAPLLSLSHIRHSNTDYIVCVFFNIVDS